MRFKWFYPGVSILIFATLYIAMTMTFSPSSFRILVAIVTGLLSYSIMLTLILISIRPKSIEKKVGLTELYEIHGWMAMVIPIAILLHVIIFWSGLESILAFDLSPTSITGYIGVLLLVIVMVTGIFSLSQTFIKQSKRLMKRKSKQKNRYLNLWLHRLSIFSVIAIYLHISNVGFVSDNQLFMTLLTVYTGLTLGAYIVKKIHNLMLPKYQVARIEKITPGVHEIELESVNGKTMDIEPGQFAFFRFVDSDVTREPHPFSFSASSRTKEGNLTVMIQEDGDFTKTLGQVKVGDKVTIEGPYGNFYPESVQQSNKPMVLFSGGIGVTPSLGVLEAEIKKNSNRRIAFIWGVGFEKDLIDKEIIERLAHENENFTFHVIFSGEEVAGYPHGFVDDAFIKSQGLEEMYEKATWHICGPAPMLDAARGLLEANDVSEEQTFIEEFAF